MPLQIWIGGQNDGLDFDFVGVRCCEKTGDCVIDGSFIGRRLRLSSDEHAWLFIHG